MTYHRKMLNGLIALLACTIMTACNNQNIPQQTSVSLQYSQPRLTETLKVSPTGTSTVLPKPIPSLTSRPSHNPTSIPLTQTPRINPQATITEQAFRQESTQMAGFSTQCGKAGPSNSSLSPQGNWLAVRCGNEGGDQKLEVVNHQGKRWVFEYKHFVGDDFSQGVGGLYPAHWSNEDYLYFTVYIGFDGGGACFYGFGIQGLYRIDLKTGTLNTVLPTTFDFGGYFIRFSPDGARIAYNQEGITILNLKTGSKTKLNVGKAAVGELTWSPDGRKLAYSTCTWVPETYATDQSKILVYSIDENASKTIYQAQGRILGINSQIGSPQFKIFEMDYAGFGEESDQFYNWDANQLVKMTLTPMP